MAIFGLTGAPNGRNIKVHRGGGPTNTEARETMMNAMTNTTVSQQWASRPADQRFESLHALGAYCASERARSSDKVVSSRRITAAPADDDPRRGMVVHGPNGVPVAPTHWAFGQLAQLAGAPAGYLRKLPSPLAADAINYGMRFLRDTADVGVLLTKADDGRPYNDMRAATGPNYGRIWNSEIVDAMIARFGDGRTGDFRVPGEFGRDVAITKDNTTIYGSDRDIFVFLADEHNRVTVPNRRGGQTGSLARGFYVWNSEVGSQSIGAAFFLFDYVCCNRIIWGMEGFKEIRLRHTKSAPDRWLEEITPVLEDYANAAAGPVEAVIKAAQQRRVDHDLDKFLNERFSKAETTAIKAAHEREESRPIETLWDAVTGVTAYAKTIKHQDQRVLVERTGGRLLDLAA